MNAKCLFVSLPTYGHFYIGLFCVVILLCLLSNNIISHLINCSHGIVRLCFTVKYKEFLNKFSILCTF